jgi:hypothetical protein
VAQVPLLCGGAAAAMLERYWGSRGVYASDYAHLVREDEGGIRATDLADALVQRGYRVRASQGDPQAALDALRLHAPPILLLGGGEPLHYVVLIGADSERVWIHDPRRGPARTLTHDDFARLWQASGWWSLRASPARVEQAENGRPGPTDEEAATAPPSRPAEYVGVDPATPRVDSALIALREGAHARAERLGQEIARGGGREVRTGLRIVATARYLAGDADGALGAWNVLDEPRIDIVDIQGLRRTRWSVASRRAGLRPGALLTARGLELARRRLTHLPAIAASRLSYHPLPDGTVEVRSAVVERPRWPTPPGLTISAGRAILADEVDLEVGPILSAGDRWGVLASWNPARQLAAATVAAAAPPLPGVLTLRLEWLRERFAVPRTDGALADERPSEERLRGEIRLEEWLDTETRLGVTLGLERWVSSARATSLGAELLRMLAEDAIRLRAEGSGWLASGDVVLRGAVESRLDLDHGDHRSWHVRLGARAVSSGAPRILWPGAGTGRVREPLLRAHPLAEDGVIGGQAFGRRLLHGTVEHRIFGRVGPLRVGGAVFVDAARVAALVNSEDGPRGFVDVGLGPFASLGEDGVAVRLAWGASGWVLSAGSAR